MIFSRYRSNVQNAVKAGIRWTYVWIMDHDFIDFGRAEQIKYVHDFISLGYSE